MLVKKRQMLAGALALAISPPPSTARAGFVGDLCNVFVRRGHLRERQVTFERRGRLGLLGGDGGRGRSRQLFLSVPVLTF